MIKSCTLVALIGLSILLFTATASGSDLYLATVDSDADVAAITSSASDPVLRVQSGYLLLLNDAQISALEAAGVELQVIARDISRDELAVTTRPRAVDSTTFPVIFKEDQLEVVRVDPGVPIEGRLDLGLRSLATLHPRVLFPKHRAFQKTAFSGSPDLDSLVNRVSQDSLYSYILQLQSFMVRQAGTAKNHQARDWIASKLTDFGCDSVVIQPFDAYLDGTWTTCYNVLGYNTGTSQPNKYLITGAHFDAVPGSPGADDNGSGSAAVLEMARAFGSVESDMTIVFALFDAEEYGLFGSEYYATQAYDRGDDIEYMLNLDMIAHYENASEANLYYGPQTGYSALLQSISQPLVGITSYFSGSSSGSDHFYFIQYGYEATFLQEMEFSTVYHSPRDSSSYMSFNYQMRMTKAALATLFVIDKGVMFSGDVTVGDRPLTVNYSAWTLDPPTTWSWDFGDGGTSAAAQPSHTYNSRGMFTVELNVTSGGVSHGLQRANYVAVLDDSLLGVDAAAGAESIVEVVVDASNTIPIRQFEIPVEFSGDLPLTYQTFSTVGCRTENMDDQSMIHLDPFNNRFTLKLKNSGGEEYNVAPGTGPIVKLYYYNSEPAPSGRTAQIIFDGYSNHHPTFSGLKATYEPTTLAATVHSGCCLNIRGNVDGDASDDINIADLTYLVAYMFKNGPAAPCVDEGNINGLGEIDITDVTRLVGYMFKSGPPPADCP